MKLYLQHLQQFLPGLDWSLDELATNLSMIGHEAEVVGEALEVKVFPNRGDVLSLRGLSRDIVALYPEVGEWKDVETLSLPMPADFFKLMVTDKARSAVWSDHLLKIENYQPTSTPPELREILKILNLQSKDFLVDLTNIVTYEVGQPLHAFDWGRIKGGMTIDLAQNNEELTLLNGKKVRLTSTMLIAHDSDGTPTDLLGTMGGANSAVTATTTDVLLQAAALDGRAIRANSRESGVKTEASYRYERGVDPLLAEKALGRFAYYLKKYAPDVRVTAYQQFLNLPNPAKVPVRVEQISRLLGTEVSRQKLTDLQRLGFVVEGDEVTPPSWRFDVNNWADVAEEVVRLIGLNNIKPQALEKIKAAPGGHHAKVVGLKHLLIETGMTETLTYSFASDGPVTLQNPRTQDQRALRDSLQHGLITTLARNPFLPKAKFFEIGKVFLPTETEMLGVVLCGVKTKDVEAREQELTQLLGVSIKLQPIDQVLLDKHDVKQKNVYWWEGKLKDITLPSAYLYRPTALNDYRPISKFPPVVRDATFLVDKTVEAEELLSVMRESEAVLIAEVIDRYENDVLGPDKVAITFRFFFQKQNGSLTDEEANDLLEQVFQQLRDRVKFEVR